MDAAQRNGYDTKKILNTARGTVLRDLYAEFYKAMNAGDVEGLKQTSRKIMRVNGTVDSAKRSMAQRNVNVGMPKELTAEQQEVLREAFETP